MLRKTLFVLALLVAQSLAAQPYLHRAGVVQEELQRRYDHAIYEASVYRPRDVRQLTPVVPDADGNVLVASLTERDGDVGATITSGGAGIWVTVVPEVQEKCRAFPRAKITMRLRQLLGLPPDARVARFLVFRVKASDLFRPAPDASISRDWPCAEHVAGCECGNIFPDDTTPEHYAWMARASFTLHELPNGYPWTHLGYTYDWGTSGDHYGASEYVLRNGASATIVAKATPAEYCHR